MGDQSVQFPTFKRFAQQHRTLMFLFSAAYLLVVFSLIAITGISPTKTTPSTLSSQISSLNLGVTAGTDDVVAAGNNLGSSFPVFVAGVQSKTVHHSAARFTSVTIPHSAQITRAYLTLNARLTTSSAPVQTKIFAENTDHAMPITSLNDFNSRPLTGGTSWSITQPWMAGTDYQSSDITAEIQTVINRPGWRSGNTLNIFWKNDGSGDNYFRQAQSFNGSSSVPPRLYIEYAVEVIEPLLPTPTPTVIPSGAGFNLVADISSEETALGMVEYGNDLYIAFHTNPKNGGPGTIVKYNDLTGQSGLAYNIPIGQGLGDIRVLNGKIYVTSLDGGSDRIEMYSYNGSSWQNIYATTSPNPIGLIDIDYFNNKFYVAGYERSSWDPVLYSSDNGTTNWTAAYTYGGYSNRFTQIAILNGKMFFTPQTSNESGIMYFDKDIFSYDGATVTPIEFSTSPMEVTDMEVFSNALYLSVWNNATNVAGMWRTTDGVNFSQVSFFGPSATKTPKLSELVVYNNKLYVAEFATSQVILYGSSDGTNWTQEFSIPATQSVYSGGSSAGSWFNHTALGVYNGRLYAVPPAEGKLYVLGTPSTPLPTISPSPIPTATLTPRPTPSLTTATINVDAGKITGPLGDIFGTLLREVYFRATDPLRPWGATRYAGQTIDRMLELASVNGQKIPIRGIAGSTFDGAYGQDGGHWRFISPDYPDRFDPGPWASDADEYMEFVRRVNGQAQVVINFGSSKSNEAAGLVSYLNGTNPSDPDVQLRISHGFTQPYNVTLFEVGNEVYANWETGFSSTQPCSYANPARATNCLGEADPAWYNKPTSDVNNYASRLVEFARAMRAKSPIPITIYAVGGDWGLGYPVGVGGETWIKRLVSIAGDDIDGFVLHFYPNNSYFGEDDVSLLGRVEAYPSTRTVTGIESFANSIDVARNWASQQRAADGKPAKDYKISVTEYNYRGSTVPPQGFTLVNGLFIADNLRLFANKKVDLANYFAIRMTETSTSSFSFFHNSDVNRPAPTFYAMKIFTKHFGNQVLNTSVSGSNITTAPGGTRGSFNYDSLTATSSLSSDGKTLYLIVVNKDLINDQTVDVKLNGFSYQSARAWELNGPTPQSTNEVADTVKISDLGPVTLSAYTFPAHSVTALEFYGSGEQPIIVPEIGGLSVVEVSPPQETVITAEPVILTPSGATSTTGTVQLDLSSPQTVESGETYQANVDLLSPTNATYNLILGETTQKVTLEANKKKTATVDLQAPEAQGAYTLTTSIDGTTTSQDIVLNYSPLFLYVDETKTSGGTLIDVTVKNYEPLRTELKIIKNGKEDVFTKLIDGKIEYQQKLKLVKPGEYKVLAVATSQGKIVDTDEYLLTVTGARQFNLGEIVMILGFLSLTLVALKLLFAVPLYLPEEN